MKKFNARKCDFCEHHNPRTPLSNPCIKCRECWPSDSTSYFELKTRMSPMQQSLWIDYCLSQGLKDGMEEKERKTKKMNLNELLHENRGKCRIEINGYGFPITIDTLKEQMDEPVTFNGHFDSISDMYEHFNYRDTDSLRVKSAIFMLGRNNNKSVLTKQLINSIFGVSPFEIEKVIFNDPATIVIWADGTKTVVKTQNGEEYDPEKGLAMAITKKALGNKRDYYHTVKHWTKKCEVEPKKPEPPKDTYLIGRAYAALKRVRDDFKKDGDVTAIQMPDVCEAIECLEAELNV